MNFKDSVKNGYNKYFVFKGRASRSEFWNFTLYSFLVSFGLAMFFGSMSATTGGASVAFAVAGWFFLVALPHLAVSGRRVHDIGLPAWLLIFIWWFPLAALIVGFFPGSYGANYYGYAADTGSDI